MMKKGESIGDRQNQYEHRFASQIDYDWLRLKFDRKSFHEILNVGWVEHFVELQLIEGMKLKMHMIHFESIVNLIQRKLMKVIYDVTSVMIRVFQQFVEFQLIELMNM
jgi:hypothetical protein